MEAIALEIGASHLRFDFLRSESIDVNVCVHRVRQGDLNATALGDELLGCGLPPAACANGPRRSAAPRVRSHVMTVSMRKTQADSDDDRRELSRVRAGSGEIEGAMVHGSVRLGHRR